MYTKYIRSLHGCSVRTTVIWILDINEAMHTFDGERWDNYSVLEIGIYC